MAPLVAVQILDGQPSGSLALMQFGLLLALLLQARCLLALLPPGSPGAGSAPERGAALGASALLAALELHVGGVLLAGTETAGAVVAALFLGLPLIAVATRSLLGPASMRPRRPYVDPAPRGGAERALAALLGAGCLALLAHRAHPRWSWLHPGAADASSSSTPSDLGAWFAHADGLDVLMHAGWLGALALVGLAWGLGPVPRRALALAGGALVGVASQPFGNLLPVESTIESVDAHTGERILLAAGLCVVFLAVFRRRAERRCAWLAALSLCVALDAVSPSVLIVACSAAVAAVPGPSRRRVLTPFALVAALFVLASLR